MATIRTTVVTPILSWLLRNPTATVTTPVPHYFAEAEAQATEWEMEFVADILDLAAREQARGYRNLHRWWLQDTIARQLPVWTDWT